MISKSQPKVLFVGAFPDPTHRVFGGNVTDCKILLQTSFSKQFDLDLVDSTQRSVAPSLSARLFHAALRFLRVTVRLVFSRPDVLLMFSSGGGSFVEKAAYAWVGRLRGVPSVLFIRSGHFMDQANRSSAFRRLAALLLSSVDVIPCQGQRWQTFYAAMFGFYSQRCPVIENWVASEELLRIGERRAAGALETRAIPNEVRILFVGLLAEFKGIHDLLEAVRRLRTVSGLPAVRLCIAGGGSDSAISEFLRSHEMQDDVELLGWVTGLAHARALADADIFALPSHTEGLPNALIEAMAAGLPSVVTPVGSVPDVINDGVNGMIVPVRDPAALATALEHLLRSGTERARLGRVAHETAAARFGAEQAAARFHDVIAGLIARRTP